MSKNNISFILHKPQLSENIGLCARGIKNFGFKNLLLIDPKPIFPNDKILATSVGAKDIIKKSKVYPNLEKSLNKTDILIATSARFRNKNIKHISLEDFKKINFNKKVSFLFGSEASGLTNNEISYSDYTLQIPSDSKFRSLNLSHSLVIVAQAVSYLLKKNTYNFQKSKKIQKATKKYKNISAVDVLEEIKKLIKLDNAIISNLDCTIICQKIVRSNISRIGLIYGSYDPLFPG